MGEYMPTVLTSATKDVRAVSVLNSANKIRVFAGSKDGCVYSWILNRQDNTFSLEYKYDEHTTPIYSLTTIDPSEEYPEGLVVSGDEKGLIHIHSPEDPTKTLYTLLGHTGPISSLCSTNDGNIVSGSWDKTAIFWNGFQLLYRLSGHTESILGIAISKDRTIFTGSADKTIKTWKDGALHKTITIGADSIRELSLLSDDVLAVCSNDSLVRLISTESYETLILLSEHIEYVYSVSNHGSLFCTGGEDGLVCLWCSEKKTLLGALQFPCTVWSVRFIDSDRIAVGCSDSILNICSIDEFRLENRISKRKNNRFDFTFEVEASGKKMHINCNRGDSPKNAAEVFIVENNLPSTFTAQIIDFLEKNCPKNCRCGEKAGVFLGCCDKCLVYLSDSSIPIKEVSIPKMYSTIEATYKNTDVTEKFISRICEQKCTEEDHEIVISILSSEKEVHFSLFDLLRMAVLCPQFCTDLSFTMILSKIENISRLNTDPKISLTIVRTLANIYSDKRNIRFLTPFLIDASIESARIILKNLKNIRPAIILVHNLLIFGIEKEKLEKIYSVLFTMAKNGSEIDKIKKLSS
eukprot:GHVP01013517.1.p1 GENE.GHVP01013517.1~~GHVP01013517.1.p1  ORF type:complete len:578 (+),score=90.02 GHVP01013517.1:1052-2785(+)